MSFWGHSDYVSVADRRAKALREAQKLRKTGRALAPVVIEGRKIATRFWGKAWCDNLGRYSDFATRLPRGRSYVSNGLVIDLSLTRGRIEALVSGSELYRVKIDIAVAAPARWKAISADCAGAVGSLVELLQGKLSQHVMTRVCRAEDGLFPTPKEIKLSCTCPDWADMCKHVAATLYGVGARLDSEPELLFTLRGVDRGDLIAAGADLSIARVPTASGRVLADDDLSALFGLAIEPPAPAPKAPATAAARKPVAAERVTDKAKPGPRPKRAPPLAFDNLVASAAKKMPKSEVAAAGTKRAPPAPLKVVARPSAKPQKRGGSSAAARR